MRIRSSVYGRQIESDPTDQPFDNSEGANDDDDDVEGTYDEIDERELTEEALHIERAQEIQRLNKIIQDEQPLDDDMVLTMIDELNRVLEATNDIVKHSTRDSPIQSDISVLMPTTTTTTTHPYPPIDQTGSMSDHDRPYGDYGHLDRRTIAEECKFNLQESSNQPTIRLNTKSFAITAWTDVPADRVSNEIKCKFGITNIQYLCVAEETSELNHRQHLHVQIILKDKVNIKTRFLDSVTATHCNYQVTHNDVAWNEYIKKGLKYIEFGEFKSTKLRGQKQWPASSPSSSSTSMSALPLLVIGSDHARPSNTRPPMIAATSTKMTVREQAEQRAQHQKEVAKQALQLAETSVHNAMSFVQHAMTTKFLHHSSWYEVTHLALALSVSLSLY